MSNAREAVVLPRDYERGWRQRVAIAIRSALLDNIDPNGVHRG
jgi:hypothetical protein